MKKNQLFLFLLALPLLGLFASCADDDAEIGEAGSKLDGINATWVLDKVIQTDETAFVLSELDITHYYNADGTPPEIVFNSSDFTYTVTDQGKRNFFGASGNWAFDDNNTPTMVTLTESGGSDIELVLASTIRPVDQKLRVKFVKNCDGTPIITYLFEYVRK